MAKPNNQFEKRQRDIAKKKKQDEKRQRKQQEKDAPATGEAAADGQEPASEPSADS
jgi:hypothetical protein